MASIPLTIAPARPPTSSTKPACSDEATTSDAFRHYGERGEGEWITIYARRGHVFLSVAGVRFDTGWGSGPRGPQWSIQSRPASGTVLRHPAGL